MKKTIVSLTVVTAVVLTPSSASADGSPTCEDMFGLGWKNHGTHVLTYVADGEAAGGGPAHLGARPGGPAPGASFCLLQAESPGVHF